MAFSLVLLNQAKRGRLDNFFLGFVTPSSLGDRHERASSLVEMSDGQRSAANIIDAERDEKYYAGPLLGVASIDPEILLLSFEWASASPWTPEMSMSTSIIRSLSKSSEREPRFVKIHDNFNLLFSIHHIDCKLTRATGNLFFSEEITFMRFASHYWLEFEKKWKIILSQFLQELNLLLWQTINFFVSKLLPSQAKINAIRIKFQFQLSRYSYIFFCSF